MDIIEMNLYTRVYDCQLKELDERTKRQLFRNGEKYIYPVGDVKYVNHSKNPNAFIQMDRQRILLIAGQTIRPDEEITIDYGENNIDFEVDETLETRNRHSMYEENKIKDTKTPDDKIYHPTKETIKIK